MKNYSTKNKQLDLRRYLLVSLLIACSGFPTFIFSPSITYPILFVYALYNFIKEKQNIDNYFFIISGIIFTINFIQYVKFDFFSFESTASLFILYIGVYFLIKSIGIDILSKYVAILKILTIVSFVFYLLVIFLPQITAIIINEIAPIFQVETGTFFSHAPTIIFYTFNFDTENFGIPRNSGPFWEPGAFAGFLRFGQIMFI